MEHTPPFLDTKSLDILKSWGNHWPLHMPANPLTCSRIRWTLPFANHLQQQLDVYIVKSTTARMTAPFPYNDVSTLHRMQREHSTTTLTTQSHGIPPVRRRAQVACTMCHARKVRCNVNMTKPCTNCVGDALECTLPSVTNQRPRSKVLRQLKASQSAGKHSSENTTSHSANAMADTAPKKPQQVRHNAETSYTLPNPVMPELQTYLPFSPDSMQSRSGPAAESDTELANTDHFKNLMLLPNGRGQDRQNPYFLGRSSLHVYLEVHRTLTNCPGDSQGLLYVFNIIPGNHLASTSHFNIACRGTNLPPEELSFLASKKALEYPRKSLRDELVRLYFAYAYPMLPVFDATAFLLEYESNGTENISPLLLQAIFFVASGVSTTPEP
jgi:hypothetical protein